MFKVVFWSVMCSIKLSSSNFWGRLRKTSSPRPPSILQAGRDVLNASMNWVTSDTGSRDPIRLNNFNTLSLSVPRKKATRAPTPTPHKKMAKQKMGKGNKRIVGDDQVMSRKTHSVPVYPKDRSKLIKWTETHSLLPCRQYVCSNNNSLNQMLLVCTESSQCVFPTDRWQVTGKTCIMTGEMVAADADIQDSLMTMKTSWIIRFVLLLSNYNPGKHLWHILKLHSHNKAQNVNMFMAFQRQSILKNTEAVLLVKA